MKASDSAQQTCQQLKMVGLKMIVWCTELSRHLSVFGKELTLQNTAWEPTGKPKKREGLKRNPEKRFVGTPLRQERHFMRKEMVNRDKSRNRMWEGKHYYTKWNRGSWTAHGKITVWWAQLSCAFSCQNELFAYILPQIHILFIKVSVINTAERKTVNGNLLSWESCPDAFLYHRTEMSLSWCTCLSQWLRSLEHWTGTCLVPIWLLAA